MADKKASTSTSKSSSTAKTKSKSASKTTASKPKTSATTSKKVVVKAPAASSEVKSTKKSSSTSKAVTKSASTSTVSVNPKKLLFAGLWILAIVFSFMLIDLLVQYLDNDYSIATVNGTRVTSSEFDQRLEEKYGSQIIETMIIEELVKQAGEDANIEIDTKEVDKIIDSTRESLGGDEQFQLALKDYQLTEERYREEIMIRLIAQEIVVEDPSDEDLKAFYDENKAQIAAPDAEYDEEVALSAYKNAKFNELSGIWFEELKTKAEIQNNIEEPPSYGLFVVTRDILGSVFSDEK